MTLPIEAHLPRLAAALQAQRNMILVAEPGAGKTTQVPQLLVQALPVGEIWVLQPRRLAARLAARRVAAELGEPVGARVGYRVRFEDVCSARTRVVFMTDALLLRSLLTNPQLRGVAAVVFDEFHGRTLAGDVGLAVLRHLQQTARPELHLMVMSATLDVESVATLLRDATVVRVPGRQFPVEIEHLPHRDTRPLAVQVRAAVARLVAAGLAGDVLVFLAGVGDIRRCTEALATLAAQHALQVVPLHGSLTGAEQDRAVQPGPQRKIILATNVAETSITLENVVAVVDSGLAHIASHSAWSGLSTLQTRAISQAALSQRAGRAGRTRAGRCLRLLTLPDMRARPAFETPELQRLDLAETVLTLAALQLPKADALPFVDAPPAAAVLAATTLLQRLGAIHPDGGLTALGQRLASLPVHPRLGRLLCVAAQNGAAGLGCAAAAYLSEIRQTAATAAAPVAGPSDLLPQLAVLAPNVAQVRAQLGRLVPQQGRAADPETVLAQAVLAAFPDRVARRVGTGMELLLCNGSRVDLAAHSVVRTAEYVVAIDAQEQQLGSRRRTVVHMASAIEADWLLDVTPSGITETDAVVWNAAQERVEQVSSWRYDSLILSETRRLDVAFAAAAPVLAAAVRARGIAAFVDMEALRQLQARIFLARSAAPQLPSLGRQDDLEQHLLAMCMGCRSFAELRQENPLETLLAPLGRDGRALLERLAPPWLILNNGRRVPIHYELDKPPWVESFLQDFFGQRIGPTVGGGTVFLTLHLLAPNRRAVQVTRDLEGFWQRHYPGLKKALARRYPRHAWPDEPLQALPPAPRRPR